MQCLVSVFACFCVDCVLGACVAIATPGLLSVVIFTR